MQVDISLIKPMTAAEVLASVAKGEKIVAEMRKANPDNEKRLRFKDAIAHINGKHGALKAYRVAVELSPVPLEREYFNSELYRFLKFLKTERIKTAD